MDYVCISLNKENSNKISSVLENDKDFTYHQPCISCDILSKILNSFDITIPELMKYAIN